jgi:metal-responsive CopG/Arc/MetJ family transcriptional regulator
MPNGLHMQGEWDVGKIKTTINVDEELWKKFNVIVIQKVGGRKLSDVIEILIKRYIKENGGGK